MQGVNHNAVTRSAVPLVSPALTATSSIHRFELQLFQRFTTLLLLVRCFCYWRRLLAMTLCLWRTIESGRAIDTFSCKADNRAQWSAVQWIIACLLVTSHIYVCLFVCCAHSAFDTTNYTCDGYITIIPYLFANNVLSSSQKWCANIDLLLGF